MQSISLVESYSDQLPTDRIIFFLTLEETRLIYRYRTINLKAGTIGLLQAGTPKQFIKSPQLLLIQPWVLRAFFKRYPNQEQSGFFDEFCQHPYLTVTNISRYENILAMIREELDHHHDSPAINAFLDVLLLTANNDYLQQHQLINSEQETLIKLRRLISMHFMLEKNTPFYANKLGLSARKLNTLVRQTTGRDLISIITSRLQTECEILLAQTNKPIKEIAYELGFNSAAHFSYFFRKQTTITPKAFRNDFKQNITGR